jgi:hypothetical protein
VGDRSDRSGGVGGGENQLPLKPPEKQTTRGPGKKRSQKSKPRFRSPRSSALDPGEDLERRVGRSEFAQGALVRLRVPVKADRDSDPGRNVISDIDVLAIDVDLRLRVTRSMLECKGGRGQAGEPDRLFWLTGLKSFVGAERAALVRPTASSRGLRLARRLGLHLLDEATLITREAGHAWVPHRFAHVGGEECRAAEIRADTQLSALGEEPAALLAFLRSDSLLARPYQVLGGLAAVERVMNSLATLPDPAGLVLAGHSLVALLTSALDHAGQSETLPNSELRARLETAIVTGAPEDEYVLDVLDQADELFRHQAELIHRAYVAKGAKRLTRELLSLRSVVGHPPLWIERYLDLVDRLRASPSVSRDLLQTTELACFEALLGGSAWKAPAFDSLFTGEHRNLLIVAYTTLREIVGGLLADRIANLMALPFDRVSSPLPDRRARSEPNAQWQEKLAKSESLEPKTMRDASEHAQQGDTSGE